MSIETNIPDTMRAVVLTGHGGMDKLEYHESWPVPQPGPGEVLVKIHACGLNNTDVNTRTAWYSKDVTEETTGGAFANADDADATWGGAAVSFPRIQGADVVGTAVAVGAGADAAIIGKRVMIDTWLRNWEEPMNLDQCGYYGSECDGGFADYTKVDQRQVHAVRSGYSDAELATFATSYITAENMLGLANVGDGDVVLIPGASGGVGSALIQLARRRGAVTIAMASESKHEQVRGAISPDVLLGRAPEDLPQVLRDTIGRDNVTVVADVVGGPYWPQLINILARGGRYTCAGAIAGPIVTLDLRTFYLRDLMFIGATVAAPDVCSNLIRYIEQGEIKPLLAQTFPLAKLREAQQAFIAKRHIGNIVVTM